MASRNFRHHPRFIELVKRLQIPATSVYGHIEMLCQTAYENANPVIGNAVDVESVAGWVGEPGALAEAMAAAKVIVEVHGSVHLWQVNAEHLVEEPFVVRKNAERHSDGR